MQIKAPSVSERAFSQSNFGLGEAYMDGAWDAEELDEFFARLLGTRLTDQIQPLRQLGCALTVKLLNRQDKKRAQDW